VRCLDSGRVVGAENPNDRITAVQLGLAAGPNEEKADKHVQTVESACALDKCR
jgi:hypothetical protein